MPRPRDEAIERHVDRAVDHHGARGVVALPGGAEQRNVEHHDVVGVGIGRNPLANRGADQRPHDHVEVVARELVRKHDRRDAESIEFAVDVDH